MMENKEIAQEIWKTSILHPKILSSHRISENYNEQKVFHEKAVLKNFAIFTGKHSCRQYADLQACNLVKNRLQNRCFLPNIAKFLRIPIL